MRPIVSISRWQVAGIAIGILALGVVASGCGSSPSPSGAGGTHTAAVTTASNALLGTILVNPSGLAIYHRTSDPVGATTCTGTCATVWPPLTVSSASHLAVGGMAGFSTFTRPDGTVQLAFHGEPLYTYSGDSQAGQTNGQGFDGIWFVVTTAGSVPSAPSTTTRSGGYYP